MPLPVEKQVVIIYAGTKGYLDELPVERSRRYEQELYAYIEAKHPTDLRRHRARRRRSTTTLEEARSKQGARGRSATKFEPTGRRRS